MHDGIMTDVNNQNILIPLAQMLIEYHDTTQKFEVVNFKMNE